MALATSSSTALETSDRKVDGATDAVKMLVAPLRDLETVDRGRAVAPSRGSAASGVRLLLERNPVGAEATERRGAQLFSFVPRGVVYCRTGAPPPALRSSSISGKSTGEVQVRRRSWLAAMLSWLCGSMPWLPSCRHLVEWLATNDLPISCSSFF